MEKNNEFFHDANVCDVRPVGDGGVRDLRKTQHMDKASVICIYISVKPSETYSSRLH